jgi:hypothetical protein
MTSKVKPTSFADETNEVRARDAFDKGIGTACRQVVKHIH